jgi:hypothetical protein
MHTSGRTHKRIATGLAVGVGAVLLLGACSPTDDADRDSSSGQSSTLAPGDDYDDGYTDYEIDADADDVDPNEAADSDASESDGADTGGYVGSSEWVLDQSEREMWNSYEDRINNW